MCLPIDDNIHAKKAIRALDEEARMAMGKMLHNAYIFGVIYSHDFIRMLRLA